MERMLATMAKENSRLRTLKLKVEEVREEFDTLLRTKGILGKEDYLRIEVSIQYGFSPSVKLRFVRSAEGLDEEKILRSPIDRIDLKRKTLLKLERHEITTIRELTWLTETELLKKRGIGKTVIADINEKLFAVGLCLGMVKS